VLAGGRIAASDPQAEIDLLLRGEEPEGVDLAEIDVERRWAADETPLRAGGSAAD
jgi:hypothetical protein